MCPPSLDMRNKLRKQAERPSDKNLGTGQAPNQQELGGTGQALNRQEHRAQSMPIFCRQWIMLAISVEERGRLTAI
ncbi:MAG: hypothetical protein RBU37_11050 [Myxococcota bacterium]|nr:hypothetical protein [Myxococcota bacterium]